MKVKLKNIITIILLLTIILLTSKINAASVSMTLNSESILKEGDTVVVTLKISNIDAGDGIDSIKAKLEYDKNVFEEITDENFEGKNKWNVNIYSTESQEFTVSKSSKVKTAGDILTISLKAKNSINKDSTTITIKEITTSGGAIDLGGTGDINVQNTSITVKKEASEPIKPPTNEVSTNTTTNTITNEVTTNTIKEINVNKVNDTASGKIPQTGENTIGIIIGVSIVTILSIIAFIKYRELKIK